MSLQLAPYSPSDLARNPRLSDALQLLSGGNINAAIDELTAQAAKALPGSAFLLAAVYFQQSRFADVIYAAQRAHELNVHSGAQTLIGVANLKLGKAREAFRALQRALDLDWQNHQAHRLGWTALIDLGFFAPSQSRARAYLEKHHAAPLSASASAAATNPVNLSNVTLCAIDCVSPALAARALQLSVQSCKFGAVKLLTSEPLSADGVETIRIRHLGSAVAYSEFVARELHRHVSTEFVLVTQWDGYVLNPQAWDPAFLNCDYIGARWTAEFLEPQSLADGHDVGNGGFSLRSRRFLTAAAQLAENCDADSLHPEDGVFCRLMRRRLETEFGVRFASGDVADLFAFEHAMSGQPTFGFHGIANLAATIHDPAFCRFEFLDGMAEIEDGP